ncbi:MAG: TRAP transporter small permease [Oscillospiraceae bacterium]|nr:TRAP transporter small permease [Oscillospiraceae bacterium]
MRNTIKTINKFANLISAFLLAGLTLLIVANIFLRNVFFIFVPGVFELTQIFLSIIAFFAVAYAHDNKAHCVVEALYKVLPRAGKWFFSLVSSLFFLATACVVGGSVFHLAITQISNTDHTMALRIPLWPFSMLGALGILLFCLSLIGDLVYIIKDREVLTNDPS